MAGATRDADAPTPHEGDLVSALAGDLDDAVDEDVMSRREVRGVPLMTEKSMFDLFTNPAKVINGDDTLTAPTRQISVGAALRVASSMHRWRGAAHAKAAGGGGGEAKVVHRSRHAARMLAAKAAEEKARRLKLAAQLVQDALEGRRAGLRQYKKLRNVELRRLLNSVWYRWGMLLLLTVLMLLAVVEPPAFSTVAVPVWVPLVEALVLVCCVGDIVLNWRTYGHRLYTSFQKKWQVGFLVMVTLCFLDLICHYVMGLQASLFRFSRPLRPFMLVAKKKSLRRLFATMMRTLPKLADVIALFVVLIIFFAVMGMQLFTDGQTDGLYVETRQDPFGTFGSSSLSVYVLTTSENFPFIFWPAMESRPYMSVAFFIPALFFFLWVAVPTLLAIVYNTYLGMSNSALRKKQLRARQALLCAYHIIHDDGAAAMDYATFHEFILLVRPATTPLVSLSMFRVLDGDNNKKISVREWLLLASVIRMNDATQSRLVRGFDMSTKTHMQRRAATKTRLVRFRALCRRIMAAKWFDWYRYTTAGAGVLSAIVWNQRQQNQYDVCYDTFGFSGCLGEPNMIIFYFMFLALAMLMAELIVRWGASDGIIHPDGLGRPRFTSKPHNFFDTFACVFCVVAQAALFAGARYSVHEDFVDVLEASRGVMVLRVLSTVKRFRSFVKLLGGIVTMALRFTVLYGCVTYSFAVVGMALFAHVPGAPVDNASDHYSFSTFAAACLALLQLTVGNDWNAVMYPNILAPNSSWWLAWYFVLYFGLCATLMFNVISGVIIDTYSEALEAAATKKEQIEEQAQTKRNSSRDRNTRHSAAALLLKRRSSGARLSAAELLILAKRDGHNKSGCAAFCRCLPCIGKAQGVDNPAFGTGELTEEQKAARHARAQAARKARLEGKGRSASPATKTGKRRVAKAVPLLGGKKKQQQLYGESDVQRLDNSDRGLPKRLLALRRRLPLLGPQALEDLRESLPDFERQLRKEAEEVSRVATHSVGDKARRSVRAGVQMATRAVRRRNTRGASPSSGGASGSPSRSPPAAGHGPSAEEKTSPGSMHAHVPRGSPPASGDFVRPTPEAPHTNALRYHGQSSSLSGHGEAAAGRGRGSGSGEVELDTFSAGGGADPEDIHVGVGGGEARALHRSATAGPSGSGACGGASDGEVRVLHRSATTGTGTATAGGSAHASAAASTTR